jgi:membrane-associated HD superfamily phosphohydrolase
MKNQMKFSLLLAFVAIISVTAIGCDKDDDEPTITCDQSTTKATEAALAFVNDATSKSKCEAYKASLQQLLKSCSSELTATEKEEFQDSIDELDCNNL